MTVEAMHPDYNVAAEQWRTMRDVVAGEGAVKAAGTRYVAALADQNREEYEAYIGRPSFFNATARAIDGLRGMVFRRAPVIEMPDDMADLRDDATLDGQPLADVAEHAVDEVLTTGRMGVLVDFPGEDAGTLTQQQARNANLRPFFKPYTAESILNWRVEHIRNVARLTQVRLHEHVSKADVQDDVDEFDAETVAQIRVLDLAPMTDDGEPVYRVRLYRQDSNGVWEQAGDDVFPRMDGQPLDFIPFVFMSPRGLDVHVAKPPLIDLAHVNLSHFRTAVDIEHGAHLTALPTPYIFGVGEDEMPSTIGPQTPWVSANENVTAGMLEFTGQGLEALEKRREVKERQMALLGARMLAPERRQAEAAETAAIHRQGEISVLAALAQAVSRGLTRALEIARDWRPLPESAGVSIALNTDFQPAQPDAQLVTAMLKLQQAGVVTQEQLVRHLQNIELLPPDEDPAQLVAEAQTTSGGLAERVGAQGG